MKNSKGRLYVGGNPIGDVTEFRFGDDPHGQTDPIRAIPAAQQVAFDTFMVHPRQNGKTLARNILMIRRMRDELRTRGRLVASVPQRNYYREYLEAKDPAARMRRAFEETMRSGGDARHIVNALHDTD